MHLHSYTVGPFAENTYLLIESGKAILIDPGFHEDQEFKSVQQDLEKQSTGLIAVVLTHAHVDHIFGLNRVLDRYDVPVYLSNEDRYLWDNYPSQARMFGFEAVPIDADPKPIPITDDWKLGPFSLDVRYTPGHAPDHIILYSEKEGWAIAGDTLFREGIGRTDLYKGSFERLEKSIREELYSLPDQTVLYPGHGPETSVGYEKKNNPFVKV